MNLGCDMRHSEFNSKLKTHLPRPYVLSPPPHSTTPDASVSLQSQNSFAATLSDLVDFTDRVEATDTKSE